MQILRILIIFFSLCASYFALGEKTLVSCTNQGPVHFDPALATDTGSMDAGAFSIFDRLMVVEYGSDSISPSLAKSWRLGPDLKSFTVKLRNDVSFHSNDIFQPSRNFNADDVIYTFERQFDPNHPWYNIFEEGFQYFKSIGMEDTLLKLEKIDDYTVKFHLKDFDASFIAKLTMGFLSIHSKEYMEQLLARGEPEKLKTHPIGTGPWIFDSYDRERERISYIANQDYFAGKPNIDRFVFDVTTNAEERRKKLESGLCHHIDSPTISDTKDLQSNDAYKVMKQDSFNINYLEFNTRKRPLSYKNVRKAMAMAIDKQHLIETARKDVAIVAKNPIPPKMWSYNDHIIDYPYDPKQAKKLLAEAGYPNGFRLKYLAMDPDIRNKNIITETIQEDLAKIGVELEIIKIPIEKFFNRGAEKIEYDLALAGWGADINDPDNILFNLLSCSSVGLLNNSNWCNQKFNRLIINAKNEPSYEKRVELYEQAQEVFHDEMPFMPLFHTTYTEVMVKELKNYQGKVFGNQKFPPHILELED